jgi:hypothetical protein
MDMAARPAGAHASERSRSGENFRSGTYNLVELVEKHDETYNLAKYCLVGSQLPECHGTERRRKADSMLLPA